MHCLLPLLCILALSPTFGLDQLCETRSRKIFLYLGETGVITTNRSQVSVTAPGGNFTRREYCTLQIETCPSCLVSINFRYLDLRDNCERRPVGGDGTTAAAIATPCRCDYIWISDSSYEDISGTPFCGYWNSEFGKGPEPGYRSETRAITITFFYKSGRDHEFSMTYTSERNRKFFFGAPQSLQTGPAAATNFFTSPFFPLHYPRDLVSEYVVSCVKYPYVTRSPLKTNDNACRIRLIFTDFHLSSSSIMEFFDGNRRRILLANGSTFRPPVIVTNSSRLMVRFTANGGSSLGFKGQFSFIQGNYNNPLLEPNTDCGGLVDDLGGAITMMNMVGTGAKTFDCVWLIRPPESFFILTGYLAIKVNKYENFAGYAELEVRDGLISDSPLLEKIHYSPSYVAKEHVTSLRSGFYVNLKASFGPSSVLGITFTSFHYNKCYTGPDFLCRNHRCVPGKVVCDGFDHCGDNSDESDLCIKDWHGRTGSVDRKWDTLTPNYYFPKVEHYSELKTATLVFIASSMGLIVFLAILIILLYRMGARNRQQNDFQSRLHTITEFLDDAEIEEIIDDDPPLYEAPPDYEVAIKVVSSEQHPNDLVKMKPHAPDVSGEGRRMVVIVPQSMSAVSSQNGRESHRCREEEVFQYGSEIPQPVSPPPPYVDEDGDVICTRTEVPTSGDSNTPAVDSGSVSDEPTNVESASAAELTTSSIYNDVPLEASSSSSSSLTDSAIASSRTSEENNEPSSLQKCGVGFVD